MPHIYIKLPMRKSFETILVFALLLVLLVTGCSKESENLQTELIEDYHPLLEGKYITYRLDSTVYVNLNTLKEVHTYIVQDFFEEPFTDNSGRTTYKIRRKIRSNTDTTQWTDNTVFTLTPRNKTLEFVDNNQRFIRLAEPIRENYTWRGNSYINTYSDPDYQYLDNWEYYYSNVGQPYSDGSLSFPETITVNQRDEILGNPDDKKFYYEINQAMEVYARGIGLVYRNFLHEAWQPSNITCPAGCYEPSSYGIRLTLINHNF
jgi:hypothetical protein